MFILIFLASLGVDIPYEVGEMKCLEALHHLRDEHNMEIITTEASDGVVLYNLVETKLKIPIFPYHGDGKKTAILVCELPMPELPS